MTCSTAPPALIRAALAALLLVPLISSCAARSAPALSTDIEDGAARSALREWAGAAEEPVPSGYDAAVDPLHAVLMAEYFGRQGYIRSALAMYMSIHESVSDPAVIERALELARYLDDFESAERLSRRWRIIEPDSYRSHLFHLSNLILLGRTAESSADLAALLTSFTLDDRRYGKLRDLLLQLRDVDISYVRRIAEAVVEPMARTAWWHLLMADIATYQIEEAVYADIGEEHDGRVGIVCESLAVLSPESERRQMLAQALATMDRERAEAASHITAAIAAAPGSSEAHTARACSDVLAGDVNQGIAYIDATLGRQPGFWRLYLTQARWLLSQWESQKGAERERTRARIIERIEHIRANQGKLPESHSWLYPQATRLLAAIHLEEKDWERSKDVLSDLAGYDSHSGFAYHTLAELAMREKEYRRAERYLGRAGSYDYNRALEIYIEIRIANKEWELAFEVVRRYRRNSQGSQSAYFAILLEGKIYLAQHDYQRAFDLYSAGLQSFDDSEPLLFARSVAAHFLGRVDIIEADMRAILEQNPDNAAALNGLGYALACHTNRLDEAEELLKRALELEPESFAIIDSYGWALFKQGRHDEARGHLEQAWEGERDPEIAAHLIELYWSIGHKDKARRFLQDTQAEFPDNVILEEVRARLGL